MHSKTALIRTNRRQFLAGLAESAAASLALGHSGGPAPSEPVARKAFIVPNFHPASCGWLTTFSNERVYCANSYLDHSTVFEMIAITSSCSPKSTT